MEVVVKLRGGLGNQLFQYFGSLELSEQIGARLILDARALPREQKINSQGVSLFPEEISSFAHKGLLLSPRNKGELCGSVETYLRSRLDYLGRILGDSLMSTLLFTGRISGDNTISRSKFPIHKKKISINNPLFNHEEFEYLNNDSIRQLLVVNYASNWFERKLQQALLVRPVALHLRLGDHFRLNDNIDFDYISKAINLTKKTWPASPIWVFSDDVEMAERLLNPIDRNLEYISPPLGSRPLETLVLMAQCKSIIMSQSSFSWWAAKLSVSLGNNALINGNWLTTESVSRFMRFGSDDFIRV